MKEARMSLPELAMVIMTRAVLGAGIGVLLSEKLAKRDPRLAVGWALVAIGALSTIPLALEVFGTRRNADANGKSRATASAAQGMTAS